MGVINLEAELLNPPAHRTRVVSCNSSISVKQTKVAIRDVFWGKTTLIPPERERETEERREWASFPLVFQVGTVVTDGR